jgi:hypothetical protein
MGMIDHHVNQSRKTNRCRAGGSSRDADGHHRTGDPESLPGVGSDGADEPECRQLASEPGLNMLAEQCRDASSW